MEPQVPTTDGEALARSMLVGVDLSGGTSTAANDQLSAGSASKSQPSLLEAYQKWRERMAAVEKGSIAQVPADAELRALRKSAKRLGKHLSEGVSSPNATVLGHAHYRKHGGKSGIQVWAKKLANPPAS